MSELMNEALKRLADRAQTFNAQTDSANETIESTNRALASMCIGLEHWVTGVLIQSIESGAARQLGLQLGYAKVEGAWQLATRHVKVQDDEVESLDTPSPLVKEGRETRIEACLYLKCLVEELTLILDEQLGRIEKAAQVAARRTRS